MMKIDVKNGVANIYTPYNPKFVKKIKGIGGAKWDNAEKCWAVPETSIDTVREFMTNIYGYSDITENDAISLKITFNEEISSHSDIVMFGKVLSHSYEYGVKIGEDVAYICGGINGKGTIKNGSVAVLSNVNRNIYENFKTKYNITIEVIENNNNKQNLLEEKERLLKRITEIDELLKEM